jgi:hypothetical protein
MSIRDKAVLAGAAVAVGLAGWGDSGTARPSDQTLPHTAASTKLDATPKERLRGVVEDCSTRSEADFPGAFTDRSNLVVGPLALMGAGGTPAFDSEVGGNKFPLLVRNGHRVTVELSRHTRRGAGLAYGPLPNGEVRLRDAHRVVRFIACRHGNPSGSSADERPVTFWSGGVLARSPRCVPLRVRVDDNDSQRVAVIRLGVARCA